jgi:hypothetical protein
VCGAAIEVVVVASISNQTGQQESEIVMRNVLLFGAVAVVLTFGGADAFAMGGGDLSPDQSPYALLAPQTVPDATMSEGRSAFTGGEQESSRGRHFQHPLAHPHKAPLDGPGR